MFSLPLLTGGPPASALLSADGGVLGAVGIAGEVMLSRASGSCAASAGRGGSGVGVDESMSRYGSASPEDSAKGVCG